MTPRAWTYWAGPAAVLGGLLWIVFVTGHTFTHGSTQSPRGAALLGLESLNFFRLLAIPPLLFAVGLVGARASRAARGVSDGRLGRAGFVVALLGLALVALGVILETWIVDPSEDFSHPLVQAGWIAYLLGLFPVLPLGMILFGVGSPQMSRRVRLLAIVIGVLAPLQWFEGILSSVSTGSLTWDLFYSALRGLLGGGWMALGYAHWRDGGERHAAHARGGGHGREVG